ncbi:MAG: hypothetical protein ACU85E_00400 [Gammaproteobacteria bacterium]
MKIINIGAILMGLLVFSSFAYADIPLQSKDEVQGKWKLEYTKTSINAKETIKREDAWEFKNGKVTITHIAREGTFYDQSPVNYEIEDGKLKISILGRQGKFDIFSLMEKDDKSMTLKGKYGDIYHFNKN